MSQRYNPQNPFKGHRSRSETAMEATDSKGLRVEQFFSTGGVHPFEQLEWEIRSAKILDDSGKTIFEQDNIEVPTTWSQLATKVVASKYFYGDVESDQREHSVKQLVHRVCRTIADRGKRDGHFASDEDGENFYNELTWLCVNQYGAFNSPVWFNVGLFDVYGVTGSRHNFHWDPRRKKAVTCGNSYEISAGICLFYPVGQGLDGRHNALSGK